MTEPIYTEAAKGYDELFARTTQLFIPALLRAAHIGPGQAVLDVATGTGAAARAAADLVGGSGLVIGGDISPSMIDVARRNLAGSPIRLEVLDGQALPFPDGQFDAVICQLGLMLFPDPARGLAEFHRVLRAGGHAAVSVTTTPERSLFARIGAVVARCNADSAERLSRFFSIPSADRLRALIGAAGFREIEVQIETRAIEFPSFAAYFGGTEMGAGLSGQEFVRLPGDLQRRVREEVRQELGVARDDQRVVIDMDVLIGSGRRATS